MVHLNFSDQSCPPRWLAVARCRFEAAADVRTTMMYVTLGLFWCLRSWLWAIVVVDDTCGKQRRALICCDSSFQNQSKQGASRDPGCLLKFEVGFPTKNHRATARR